MLYWCYYNLSTGSAIAIDGIHGRWYIIGDIFTAISIAYLLCTFVYFTLDDKPMFRLVGRQRTIIQAVMFVLGFLSVLYAAYWEVLR